MIGIIAAMSLEAEKLIGLMENAQEKSITGIEFHYGELFGKQAVIAVSGVGKVNAARCTEAMIISFCPDCIINTGVAGSLDSSLNIGDIVIADKVLEHDMDTTLLGDEYGYLSNPPLVFIPADPSLLLNLTLASEEINAKVIKGTIASGDQFIGDPVKKNFIKAQFSAVACEMEGAAVGHVCYLSGVPFSVIRAISDNGNADSAFDYPTFARLSANKSAELLEHFIKAL